MGAGHRVDARRGAASSRRTFVLSDAHGYPELVRNALEHGGFDPDRDRLVYAGDLLDRGPDPQGCLDLLEENAAEVLFGNHELAVLLGLPIADQDAASAGFGALLEARALAAEPGSRWKVASCVQGVLISHAGVSSRYAQVWAGRCRRDPRLLVSYLNRTFVDAIGADDGAEQERIRGILGDEGPLWFRPERSARRIPLPGVVQIAGHTPPEVIEGTSGVLHGFHLIDPHTYRGLGDSRRYRYALIENGRVRVEQGTLDAWSCGGANTALCA